MLLCNLIEPGCVTRSHLQAVCLFACCVHALTHLHVFLLGEDMNQQKKHKHSSTLNVISSILCAAEEIP